MYTKFSTESFRDVSTQNFNNKYDSVHEQSNDL